MINKQVFHIFIVFCICLLPSICLCQVVGKDKFDVYELIKLEDNSKFEKNIKELPPEFNWMNKDRIRFVRSQYLKDLKTVKDKYSSCFSTIYGNHLTEVFSEIGDSRIVYFYGVCNSIDNGESGCDVLKENFPDQYHDCINSDFDFWTTILPFSLIKDNNNDKLHKFSKNYCEKKLKNTKNIPDNADTTCKKDLVSLLMTIRIILFDKNPDLCSEIPSSDFISYCQNSLKDKPDICDNYANPNLVFCKDSGLNNAVQAIVHNDRSRLFTSHNPCIHDIFAAHFMDNNACITYFDSILIERCKEQMETEIQRIKVRFP